MFTTKYDIHEIIPNLYLGSIESANNIQKLKELNIKKVLSIMNFDAPLYKPEDNINHKIISIADMTTENIIKYFGECLNFIKGEEKEKILVHCMAGASRSATVVIAYLMWKEKKSVHDELNFVNSKRSIFPNPGFLSQLKTFEKLLIENDYDINKINFEQIKWEPGFNN